MIKGLKNIVILILSKVEDFLNNNSLKFIAKLVSFIKFRLEKYFEFIIFSLSGLLIDIAIFSSLVYVFKVNIFTANIISIYGACTIAYCFLGKRIFVNINFTKEKYIPYIIYQIFAGLFFSYMIKNIDIYIGEPILSKFIIIIITIICNYLFFNKLMSFKSK